MGNTEENILNFKNISGAWYLRMLNKQEKNGQAYDQNLHVLAIYLCLHITNAMKLYLENQNLVVDL